MTGSAALALEALLDAEHAPHAALAAVSPLLDAPTRRRRSRVIAAPGAPCEVDRSADAGPPRLAPAPGSVAGIDETRAGVTIYRPIAGGRLEGRVLGPDARVIVSRRFPSPGDLAVVATRRAIRVVATGPGGAVPLPADGRFVGTVEAVIRSA